MPSGERNESCNWLKRARRFRDTDTDTSFCTFRPGRGTFWKYNEYICVHRLHNPIDIRTMTFDTKIKRRWQLWCVTQWRRRQPCDDNNPSSRIVKSLSKTYVRGRRIFYGVQSPVVTYQYVVYVKTCETLRRQQSPLQPLRISYICILYTLVYLYLLHGHSLGYRLFFLQRNTWEWIYYYYY